MDQDTSSTTSSPALSLSPEEIRRVNHIAKFFCKNIKVLRKLLTKSREEWTKKDYARARELNARYKRWMSKEY